MGPDYTIASEVRVYTLSTPAAVVVGTPVVLPPYTPEELVAIVGEPEELELLVEVPAGL